MPITLHWFLPTSGDSRDVVGVRKDVATRPASLDYLAQIARAAEQLGFVGALTPTGLHCEDAWLLTAALSRESARLKFLVAFRPGFISPLLAAHQAATYQRVTDGRLLLNVVTGGDPVEQRRFGDWLSHDQRYDRTDEFLTILRGAWSDTPFDFEGAHYQVAGARVTTPPEPRPLIYFGGASPAAEPVAARRADVYLLWGETPEMVTERLERMRALAATNGRTLRFGVRVHVITRDTSEAAWAEADRLLAGMPGADVAAAQAKLHASESVGQQRMLSLHRGSTDRLEVYPNLWAGIGLVRGGAGTAFVGSHDEVADRIEEYHQLGIDEFILSGYPHLEEAYWFGENVIPRLRRRGLVVAVPPLAVAAA
jgi:alkanesulfonate monooxygenase